MRGRIVTQAHIVLGQVAPTPWISEAASHAVEGMPLDESVAEVAGIAAIQAALPLDGNHHKVQLAKVCVQRAILRAAGLPTGGLDD